MADPATPATLPLWALLLLTVLPAAVTALVGLLLWFLNERQKRRDAKDLEEARRRDHRVERLFDAKLAAYQEVFALQRRLTDLTVWMSTAKEWLRADAGPYRMTRAKAAAERFGLPPPPQEAEREDLEDAVRRPVTDAYCRQIWAGLGTLHAHAVWEMVGQARHLRLLTQRKEIQDACEEVAEEYASLYNRLIAPGAGLEAHWASSDYAGKLSRLEDALVADLHRTVEA